VYWRHDIYLAGVAVRARDAIELIWRLRSYGFNDTAERIERALTDPDPAGRASRQRP